MSEHEDWRYLRSISTARLAARIKLAEEGARVNWENFAYFRDSPKTHDQDHFFRTTLWADMAKDSYGFVREMRDEILSRSSSVTLQ